MFSNVFLSCLKQFVICEDLSENKHLSVVGKNKINNQKNRANTAYVLYNIFRITNTVEISALPTGTVFVTIDINTTHIFIHKESVIS